MAAPSNPLLPFQEARRLVEEYAAGLPQPQREQLDLLSATGRYLAEPICADRDMPPFDRATRDGFAVIASDTSRIPADLKVICEIRAGMETGLSRPIAPGEAVEIMTGAPLPPGADAVVMVEHTDRIGDQVTIHRPVRSGENFVARGAEARAGDTLLSSGTRLGPPEAAIAASTGRTSVPVFRKARVGILPTGDELVETSQVPAPHQIRDSNSYSLVAQVADAGAIPALQPVARDSESDLLQALQVASSCDLLLLTGGVSAGKYDLVEQVLSQLGARFIFTGAAIQPGKPIVFGLLPRGGREVPFLGLPGNPISTMVTFELFANPVLRALGGGSPEPLRFLHARLQSELRVAPGLTRFLPAVLNPSLTDSTVDPVRWQGSGDLVSAARANCFLVVVPERKSIAAGEWVPVLLRNV